MEALSDASTARQAEAPFHGGYEALKSFTDATKNSVAGSASGGNAAGGGAGMPMHSGSPWCCSQVHPVLRCRRRNPFTSPGATQTNIVGGPGGINIATGKSLIAGVTEKLSLFVQNAGMKICSRRRAGRKSRRTRDDIELTAQKTMKLLAWLGDDRSGGETEILLTSGKRTFA